MPSDFNADRYFPTEKIGDYQPGQDAPGSPQAAPGGQEGGGLGSAVKVMTTYLGNLSKRQQQADMEAQTTVQTNSSTGMTQLTIPTPLFMENAEKSKAFDHIQNMYNQDIARIEAERAQRAKRPWASALATIAGSLAANDPNPTTRGLGQAAIRLNPTDQELREQERPLLREAGQMAYERERETRLEATSERRFQQDQQRTQHAENAKVFQNLNSDAMRGLLTDPRPIADMLKSTGMKGPEADAKAKQLFEVSQQKQKLDEAASATKDAREARALKEKARESDDRIATMLKGFEIHSNTALEVQRMKDAEAERKANAKGADAAKKIPATLPDKLSNLTAAEKALDDVEAGIRKYGEYMGPVAGRIAEPIGAYLKRDVSKFFDKMKLQVAQAIKSTGAGARGFGPMERGFFESLAESKNHSPEQNLGIIDAWRDYIRQNRSAYYETYEGLRDQKFKRAFGKDAGSLYQDEEKLSGDPLGIR